MQVQDETVADDRQFDPVSGVQVVGGDMSAHSDLEQLQRPAAVAALCRAVVAARRPSRVLLAGPQAALLHDVVPESASLDVLVRGLPDARAIEARAGANARVTCGGLPHFVSDEPFDLVVALGGPTALLGPDSPGLSEPETITRLTALLAPHGVLITATANSLGVQMLSTAETPGARDSDDAWHVGAEGFDDRSPVLAEHAAALGAAGLTTLGLYAALPGPAIPSLLVERGSLSDESFAGLARVRAVMALTQGLSPEAGGASTQAAPVVLRDVARLTEQVCDAGLLVELAPAWVAVTTRAGGAGAGNGGEDELPLPSLVEVDSLGTPALSRVLVVGSDGTASASWAGTGPPGRASDTSRRGAAGLLARDLTPLRLAPGRSLEASLRAAAAARDHGRVRDLLAIWVDWLPRVEEPRRWSATPANVVVHEGQAHLVDPSHLLEAPTSVEVALVHGVRHFVLRLLASEAPHAWPLGASAEELTRSLAAMAGLVVTDELAAEVARLESAVGPEAGGTESAVRPTEGAGTESPAAARIGPARPPTAAAYEDLLLRADQLERALRERTLRIRWLEGTLRARDRHVRVLERSVSVESSRAYKAIFTLSRPVPAVRRRAGEALRRIRRRGD